MDDFLRRERMVAGERDRMLPGEHLYDSNPSGAAGGGSRKPTSNTPLRMPSTWNGPLYRTGPGALLIKNDS
jgi:hypothetical protein